MISPVNFNPAVVFTAAPPPRRDTARDEAPADSGGQDAFNRMLAQQRDAARLSSKLASPPPVPTQAPAPEQPPMQIPESGPATGPIAREASAAKDQPATRSDDPRSPDKAEAGDRGETQAKAQKPSRTQAAAAAAADPGEPADPEGRPPQLDPIEFNGNDRHAYHAKMLEITRQAKLAQMPSKHAIIRLPPVGPEDMPTGTPCCPPGADPAEPGLAVPAPPLVECPVEPVMALMVQPLEAAKPRGAGGAERHPTQDLQAQAPSQAVDARTAPAAVEALLAQGDRAPAGAVAAALAAATSAPAPAAAVEIHARPTHVDLSVLPALAPTAPGAPAPIASAPAPQQATLDARPGSEAFAGKLGAQVAVWVREGVHEAQLQLNPADMGPVRVAILLEGAAAQVNFTAEHSLTRQALEQALPTLAGSLAEAGFTLAGGGVFDQPRQPERGAGEPTRQAGGTNRATGTDSGAEPARTAAARPRGMVDLVA